MSKENTIKNYGKSIRTKLLNVAKKEDVFHQTEGATIVAAFKEICSVPYEEDGVDFDIYNITAQNITEFKDYHGIRLSIPVKMDTISQVLTMDIGFGDVVTPKPIDLDYPVLLENLPAVSIMAYSLETVIAEKMHAIIDLADQSSRMTYGI